ncbi:MAG TPA: hypothetical protein VEW42_01820 [Candidatus Eisenbacteria bacterium]|nr:hypothetical protein [Candidatus Eisenbacteria bacterium]
MTEAKVNSVTKSCLHPENYVLSSHEWSWINPFSPIGFGGYINTCTYNGTKSTTIACGKDTYGGKTTYCSTGVYDSTNHLACPGGDGAPISTNYTGCGNYVFCCASHNGTIPPAPTLSKGLACQAAGGTCYFNLSGCANGMVSIGAKDCNAPQFCCAESSKGDNPGCDPTKQNCGGPANSPTPSCTNGKTTQLVLNIKLPGIGGGTFENNTPAHVTKHGSLVVKDGAGTFLFGQSHDYSHGFGHANGNGKLGSEKVNLGTQAVCGKTYTVEVKLPGYITIKKTVVYGQDQTIDVGENDVTPGDIVGNNNNNFITPDGKIVGDDVVNILDYNVMKDCRNASASAGLTFQNNTQNVTIKCGDLINFFDYTDGGTQESVVNNAGIGEWDANYNMWLRGFIKANGY